MVYQTNCKMGPSWSWSYGSWIYNYLCNKCLSPLTLCVWIPLRQGAFDTKLCDKVCQWLAAGTTVSSTNKTDHHDITKILLKVVLNTIKLNLTQLSNSYLEFKLLFFFFRHFWIWSCKKLYFSNMLIYTFQTLFNIWRVLFGWGWFSTLSLCLLLNFL